MRQESLSTSNLARALPDAMAGRQQPPCSAAEHINTLSYYVRAAHGAVATTNGTVVSVMHMSLDKCMGCYNCLHCVRAWKSGSARTAS